MDDSVESPDLLARAEAELRAAEEVPAEESRPGRVLRWLLIATGLLVVGYFVVKGVTSPKPLTPYNIAGTYDYMPAGTVEEPQQGACRAALALRADGTYRHVMEAGGDARSAGGENPVEDMGAWRLQGGYLYLYSEREKPLGTCHEPADSFTFFWHESGRYELVTHAGGSVSFFPSEGRMEEEPTTEIRYVLRMK